MKCVSPLQVDKRITQHLLRDIVAYRGEVVRDKEGAQVGRGWSNATFTCILLHHPNDQGNYILDDLTLSAKALRCGVTQEAQAGSARSYGNMDRLHRQSYLRHQETQL